MPMKTFNFLGSFFISHLYFQEYQIASGRTDLSLTLKFLKHMATLTANFCRVRPITSFHDDIFKQNMEVLEFFNQWHCATKHDQKQVFESIIKLELLFYSWVVVLADVLVCYGVLYITCHRNLLYKCAFCDLKQNFAELYEWFC